MTKSARRAARTARWTTLAGLGLLLLALGAGAAAQGPAKVDRPFLWKNWLLLDVESNSRPALAFLSYALALSPEGKTLACSDGGGSVRTWDLQSGEPGPSLEGPPSGGALALAYTADGRLLLAGQEAVVTWKHGAVRAPATFRWPVGLAETAVFSRDGARVAFGSADGTIAVYDVADGKQRLFRRRTHTHPVLALAFTPDGKMLASGSADGSIRLWEIQDRLERGLLQESGHALVRGLAFDPQGKVLAAVGGREGVILWDVASGNVKGRFGNRPVLFSSVAFAPDGRTLATGSRHGYVDWWDVATGKRDCGQRGHAGLVREVHFADDVTVASVGSDGAARLWEGGKRVPRAEPLSEARLRLLSRTLLQGEEGPAAWAVLRLAAAPEQAVPLLREHVRPSPPLDNRIVLRLLSQLDSAQFVVRETAARDLEGCGPLLLPALRKALARSLTLETRRRVEKIQARLEEINASPERRLFNLRAVLVLERIGNSDALRLLQDMVVGLADEAVTREAQQALARLGQALR